ncbi:MAG: penicillin-binding protein [Rhodospirillales bacterium]|nr:penicillin-binding protein [Rhodospirillales bacterium]
MKLIKLLLGAFVVLGLVVTVLGGGVAALAYWHFSRGLPDYKQLASYEPPIVTRVHAGDGRLLAEYASERRVFVPIAAIPPRVIDAFLAAEDKNFYTHPGIDPISMLRAGVTDLARMGSGRRPSGASTITQQVAKNFLLTNELSLERKVKEALLAIRIEEALSKDRILELYLNEIYLGGGAYGIAAAALNYFNKPLDELTIAEAGFLGALPKAPNNYNPQRFPEAAKARRDWVVGRMAEDGYITAAQAETAIATPLETRRREEATLVRAPFFAEEVRRELSQRYGDKALYEAGFSVRTSLDPALQAVAERALRDGLVAYDRKHGWRGATAHLDVTPQDFQAKLAGAVRPAGAGDWRLAVVLADDAEGAAIGFADGAQGRIPFEEMRWARPELDDQRVGPPPRQAADVVKPGDVVLVEPVVSDKPAADAKPEAKDKPEAKEKADKKGAERFALRQIPEVSGGLVVLDPHTGRVLAMVGGYSHDMSQFNRVTQAKRQPGSAIKPFVYMAALDNGFTPSTLILDAPFVADQGPGLPKWKPTNYNTTKFSGPTPLRVGVEDSKNMMTARLGSVVGLDKVADYVEKFGIMDHMPEQYSMLLGAGETTPLRLATAYAMIVNGGKRVTPTFIDRIQDRNGKTVFRADARDCPECSGVDWHDQPPPAVPDTRETVEDPRTAYQMVSILQGVIERGTGRIVGSVGKPLAGKTGTTSDYRDNWFMGFSPDLVAGAFVGFDDNRTLGEKEEGARNAAPIFRDFMAAALKDKPATGFRIPPGIRLVRVNPSTGQLARPGDRSVIYEAFKPGTEPNGDSVVVNGYGVTDVEPAAAGDNGVAAAAPRISPTTGTGGLY